MYLALSMPVLGVASSSSSRELHPLIGACRLYCSHVPPHLHARTQHAATSTARVGSKDNGTQLLLKYGHVAITSTCPKGP
jgi:hypothetical protein